MDLIIVVLVVAIIGFAVYAITTKVPMPPGWATAIQVLGFIIVLLYLLRVFGVMVPNVIR